jgi:butyrate kinase
MESWKILVINPGSTSTKIAVYENSNSVFLKIIRHKAEELQAFERITDQLGFRKNLIMEALASEQIDLPGIKIIIGRGGMIKPVESGIYEVNDRMKDDLTKASLGEHASNLGGLIAYEIAATITGARAFIADPVVVDELQDVARITGHPLFERKSIFHALNQKAVARSYAQSTGRRYEDLNLIITHLGGGITIGTHYKGKVIDVNQGLDGEGPLSPERSGTLPVGDVIKACFSGKYNLHSMLKMVTGEGGFVAYFGTNDAIEIEMMARNGDTKALLIQEALGYQVAKYIGASATVLEGHVDAIILTGGLANNKMLTDYIGKRVSFIAPVKVYPGEDEMKALAMNALLVLNNQVVCKEYI